MRRSPLQIVLLVSLALTLSARPATADCPLDPSDVAPGVTEAGMPPTWRVTGDGNVTVRDLVVLKLAANEAHVLQWSTPLTAGCPVVPADLAPGNPFGGTTPPYWNIAGDGTVTGGDLDVALDRALGRIQFLPGAGRPLAEGDRALAGQILGSATGTGLLGVSVTVTGPGYSADTTTDAQGEFLVTGLPLGNYTVHLDGSTATGQGGVYGVLGLMAQVTMPGTTDLPPTTLPDVSNPESANGTVPVDGNGKSFAPFMTLVAGAMMPDVGLSGGAGSKFAFGGVPAVGPVMLNVTPVPGDEVPMPLPSNGGKLNPGSFVSIMPADATFDTTEVDALVAAGFDPAPDTALPRGLDALLPNLKGLPVGTLVDVWSFDHDAAAWLNRSVQTGYQGIVVDLGDGMTAIHAEGVIIAGGWHSPVIPVDDDCATRLIGRVLDGLGAPLAGVFIGTSVASFGQTGVDGTFSIDSVPAYTGATLQGGCAKMGIVVTLTSPLGSAHETLDIPIDVMVIQQGGETSLGDLVLPVGLTGCVGGRVTDNGTPGAGSVTLTFPGVPDLVEPLDADGSFFVNRLEPGGWVASYTFSDEEGPRMVPFLVPAGRCTSLNIGRSAGSGQRDINVFVVLDTDRDPSTSNQPVPGAMVQLFGTDPGSTGGLLGTTGPDGFAHFQGVDGPFFVTAQADITGAMTGARLRLTTSLPEIDPAGSSIGVLLFFEEDNQSVQTNATVSGTVLNIPNLGSDFLQVRAEGRGHDSQLRSFDFPDPAYTVDVLSGQPFDMVLERLQLSPGSDSPIPRAALFVPGISVTPGEDRILDFDLASPNLIPFNTVTPLTVSGGIAEAFEQSVALRGLGPAGEQVDFQLFRASEPGGLVGPGDPAGFHLGPWPDSLSLPNLAAAAFGGMSFTLQLQEDGFTAPDLFHELNCDLALGSTTPGSIAATIPVPPGIVAPGPFTSMSVATANTMTATMTLPMGDSGLGLNFYFIGTQDGGPEGLDGAGWTVFLPATSTSVTLRPPPRPVFADATGYGIEASRLRLPMAVDFDTFFTADINQNLHDALVGINECEAHSLRPFAVSNDE